MTGPNWHTPHLDHVSTSIKPLRHTLRIVFGQGPPVGPHGIWTGPKLHMHNYIIVPTKCDHK